MKSTLFIAAFIFTLMTSASAFASTSTSKSAFASTSASAFAIDKSAPELFKGADHFKKAFPTAIINNVELKGRYTLVNFTWNNLKLQAFYDTQGNSIGTSREIAIKDLPLAYLVNIKNEYPDYTLAQAIEFDQTADGLKYYVTLQGSQRCYVLEISPDGTISVFKKMKN